MSTFKKIFLALTIIASTQVRADMPTRFSGPVIAPSFNATGATINTVPYWDSTKNLTSGATTSLLPEGTNLYYSDARARAAMTGSSNTYTAGPQSIGNQVLTVQIANNVSTGTTLNKLVKLDSSGNAIIATTTDTSGIKGIAVTGSGTTGNVDVSQIGWTPCIFDGSTTAGDYVVNSTTVNGDCHDAGSTAPTTTQNIGTVIISHSGASTQTVLLAGSGGGGGSGTTLNTPVIAGNGSAFVAATTTGSGSTVVLATSPTLVTPALGTPSSGVATNLTGLPLSTGVTGTLPVTNGGTGSATPLTQFGVKYATTTTAEATTAAGTAAQVLQGNAAGAPTWVTPYVATQGQSEGSSHSVQTIKAPYNQATNDAANSYLIETGNKNLLVNPSFEASTATAGWTTTKLSGTTFTSTVNSSDAIDGKQSLNGSLTAATGEISQDVTPFIETNGVPMVASCHVNTTFFNYADMQVCARTGGTDIQCNNVPAAGAVWQMVSVNFTGPVSGSVGVSVKNTVSGNETINMDDCYVGKASTPQNFGQVSQAQVVGTLYYVPTASCTWSSTTTSMVPFGAQASCPTPTVTGVFNTTAGKIPGGNTTNLPPGEYELYTSARMTASTSGVAATQQFQLTTSVADANGNTSSTAATNSSNGGGLGVDGGEPNTLLGRFVYTQAQSSVTFSVQGYTSSASNGAFIDSRNGGAGNGNGFLMVLKRYPTSSEIAYRADLQPAYYNGTQVGVGGGWSNTSTTYADFSVATTSNTLTAGPFSGITCVAEATKLPAVTCAPNRPGAYWVCASSTAANALASTGTKVRMVDGSTVLNGGSGVIPGSNGGWNSVTTCGMDYLSNTASVTWKLQGLTTNGSNADSILQNSDNPITWSVVAINAGLPSPLLMGSVTSTSTGQEHIERAFVGDSSCSGSPCTIASQSGSWLSSITRTGAGAYTLNFAASEFSAKPSCHAMATGTFAVYCFGTAGNTSSAFSFSCRTDAGSATDTGFEVICMGPR